MSDYSMMQTREVLRQPFFQITLNGKTLPPEQHKKIAEVVIEDFDDKLNIARIVIVDSDDYYFVNNTDLVEDATVSIVFGNIGHSRLMISGIITLVEASFQKDGLVKLSVSVIDKGVKMAKVKKTRKWEYATVSNVVKAIIEENGWFCQAQDTSTVLPQITQNDETDLSFIYRLASENGYYFYCVSSVAEGVFYFGDANLDDPPVATLNYMKNDCSIISCTFNYESKGDKSSNSSDIDASSGDTESSSDELGSADNDPVNANSPKTLVNKETGMETYVAGGQQIVQERKE